jgi:glycogen debranching enzyme
LLKHNLARCFGAVGLLWISPLALPQSSLSPVPAFPIQTPGQLTISREAVPELPFSVIGPRGAILGTQDGTFELWLFPWKILSQMRISVNLQDYPVPIQVNPHAAEIEVEPDETTITYSHANFTIRQIMLAPQASPQGSHSETAAQHNSGAMVLFQLQAIRPMTVTFSFNPMMQRMWPAESPDRPSPEWVKTGNGSGFYILHLNFPDHAAALAMPGADYGILPPYQERAAVWPLQFVLHFDPKQDSGKLYPLLATFANSEQTATKQALQGSLETLDSHAQAIFDSNARYYKDFVTQHTSIDTPDTDLNAAFSWAETSIDQLRVRTGPRDEQQALTAGFVGSGDSARPGFGWFFGRDALWTLYAVNSYGDFATTKEEIRFLLDHQRDDGKIMHEWSQTAGQVDWAALPYQWASSDATCLLPMAVDDYLKISGDQQFVRTIWPNLEKAWTFETSHDMDGDGIYDNSQGSGWVESWVPAMPHQEIYLAALDEQASLAFANLAGAAGHDDVAQQARQRAAHLADTIEKEYYPQGSNFYAFSWEGNAKRDQTASIYPAVAWWDGTWSLQHPDPMMERWAASEFSTDWGTRDISDQTSFYDPISYHQGSVWPLFTGWVSIAEYRAGHPLSGYAHLMQNANLTWAQDLGNVTELLSGQFYQVFGRSTAHQLWSSAMVISPALRGLFGLEWDVPRKTLTVTPHLPATWDHATIRRLPFGDKTIDLTMRRQGDQLLVRASDPAVHLISHAAGAKGGKEGLILPLPAVEAAISEHLPEFGAETHQMKVLDETHSAHSLVLRLSAPGGSRQTLSIRENLAKLKVTAEGADLGEPASGIRSMQVQFPDGAGYQEKTVTLTW